MPADMRNVTTLAPARPGSPTTSGGIIGSRTARWTTTNSASSTATAARPATTSGSLQPCSPRTGGGDRGADALQRPQPDQRGPARRETAEQRRQAEDDQAGPEHALAPVHVADPP